MNAFHRPVDKGFMIYSHLFKLLFLAVLFCSCEGGTDREFSIVNHSLSTITVKTAGFADDTLTFALAPQETEIVKVLHTLGGQSNPGEPEDYLQFLTIFSTADTADVSVDELNRWTICSNHERKFPSWYVHTFLLKVNEADFE